MTNEPPHQQKGERFKMSERHGTYYDQGSVELATETALTVRRLEKRRTLTRNSDRLVIVLVGLPGRGKSFVARKLQAFHTWRGCECRVFNVGKYRREAHSQLTRSGNSITRTNSLDPATEEKREDVGACDASFFDPKNSAAAALREQVASAALDDMLKWLDFEEENDINEVEDRDGLISRMSSSVSSNLSSSVSSSSTYGKSRKDRVAIFDATNSTIARRNWILEECTSPLKRPGKQTGVVFVESICDDEELLDENFRFKIDNSPDFQGMSKDEAITDLKQRVKKYEEQYETLEDDTQSYIKIFNLSSKLLVNHIYGRMAKTIVPALMAWNIGTRPIFFCRAGQTTDPNVENNACNGDGEDGPIQFGNRQVTLTNMRGDTLGEAGRRFRDSLCDFIEDEGKDFMLKRLSAVSPHIFQTGTSISGVGVSSERGLDGSVLPFPCHVMCSTMPRAVQTATWERLPFALNELSCLNPLDKGDFSGKELEHIKEEDPEWYARLENDPFHTRFPGGECYADLINRLEPCVIEMEQQVGPVLVVSHISALQVLISYFRNSPVEECTSIEVPMHTVLKFTPVRGGGWKESQNLLGDEDDPESELSFAVKDMKVTSPIWGDHRKTCTRKGQNVGNP